jgi:geranylgeranyl diphosphate synthase type I
LLACEAVGSEKEKALPIAAALEFVHAFSLVHDDIMDRDELRRGRPTMWKKWGEPLAINAGDGIFTKVYESALETDVDTSTLKKVLEILTERVLEMCEGQALDVGFELKESISTEDYIDMSLRKTGAVMEASTRIGAIVGGGSDEEVEMLAKFGRKVGLAFQIWDDYIDFASDKTGKTFGSDIKKGKKTSLVCTALDNTEGEDKEKLAEILKSGVKETTDDMVKNAIEILNNSGAVEKTKEYAKGLIDEAKGYLKDLKDSEAKQNLLDFADFVVGREH